MSVDLSVTGQTATIKFNRPQKLNAFTDAMWGELVQHLDRCERDDGIRAVVITGEGRGFSAGADISGSERTIDRKPGVAGSLQMMTIYSNTVRRLYHLPKPTIAAVRGPTIGIAWTMALCCDWVLAGDSTRFRAAFLNLAKVPEAGFQFLASKRMGEMRARDMIYRAPFVTAAEAVEFGLATRTVPDEDLLADAYALAEEAAALAPVTFSLTKCLFNRGQGDFDAFLDMEMQAIAIATVTSDGVEGTAAFKEGRTPRYSGV